jgi:hypothetical protein
MGAKNKDNMNLLASSDHLEERKNHEITEN